MCHAYPFAVPLNDRLHTYVNTQSTFLLNSIQFSYTFCCHIFLATFENFTHSYSQDKAIYLQREFNLTNINTVFTNIISNMGPINAQTAPFSVDIQHLQREILYVFRVGVPINLHCIINTIMLMRYNS